jgi:predicted outer membrane repeat protein
MNGHGTAIPRLVLTFLAGVAHHYRWYILLFVFCFHRSTVTSNDGGLIGGVLSIGTNSYAAFFDTLFDNNTANFGGVIHAGSSLVLLQEVVMIANNATTSGGAMFTYENGISEIIDSQFKLNAAGEYGGAIFMSDTSNVDLETTNFDGNVVLRGIRRGDHILVGKGANLDGCTFEVNQFSNPASTIGVVDENGMNACNE